MSHETANIIIVVIMLGILMEKKVSNGNYYIKMVETSGILLKHLALLRVHLSGLGILNSPTLDEALELS